MITVTDGVSSDDASRRRTSRARRPAVSGYRTCVHTSATREAQKRTTSTVIRSRDEIGEQLAIAIERELTVGVALDVAAASGAHLLEIVDTGDKLADRRRQQIWAPRQDNEPAPHLPH